MAEEIEPEKVEVYKEPKKDRSSCRYYLFVHLSILQ